MAIQINNRVWILTGGVTRQRMCPLNLELLYFECYALYYVANFATINELPLYCLYLYKLYISLKLNSNKLFS